MIKKLSLGITAAFIGWVVWTNKNIKTTTLKIENENIPAEFDGFKIAHVSDLHNHPWGEKLIEKINIENPDMIGITGDLVDSRKPDFEIALQFVEEVNKIAPIYYATGNHEARLQEYNHFKKQLEKAHVNMMDDQSAFIEKGTNKIQIIGVQDPDFVEPRNVGGIQSEIVRGKMNELLNSNYFTVMLSHRPEHFEQYVNADAGLVMTGHAHGGQVRIPFVGGLVAPHQGILPKYTAGVYKEQNTSMVVSRGLGNSIIPVRINNMPELVIIKLQAK